jgi:glycosyltransferase involved in cell wall biosynthesis
MNAVGSLPKERVDAHISISIIVPVYNVEKYIDDCLLSLRVQSHANLEIIVVSDGSLDSSVDRARAHAASDDRILILEQENLGLGGARNTGLAHATGDFVTYMDSDDILSASFLEKLVAAQRREDFDVVSGRFVLISEDCQVIKREGVRRLPDWSPSITDYELILGLLRNSAAWGRLYRRSLLLTSGVQFPLHIPHQDLFFVYKILRNCSHTFVDDAFGYYWRQRGNSLRQIQDVHFRIPTMLREETNAFFDTVSANERERVLAARRNVFLLQLLLVRSKERGGEVWDQYLAMLEDDQSSIREDFAMIDGFGYTELDAARDVRELLDGERLSP